MARKLFLVAIVVLVAVSVFPRGAEEVEVETVAEVAPGVPRHETLILENPTGRVVPANDFNRWRPGVQSASTGLQQLALDALWYIDPNAGIDGVWDNSLAAERPIYNDDFTQMTVRLREGIYWSDGVEFTADDVIYTVQVQKDTPGMAFTGQFREYVASMEKPDDYTVVFNLTRPNSRFHGLFTVRWSACFIMPKHVFEQQADPLAFRFDPPVSLGAYVLRDYDPDGNWYLWERREDWDRTTLGRFGEPGPRFAMYTAPGPAEMKVMQMQNADLDVIHDITPEGMIRLAQTNPTSRGWFESFPWAHPDPTLPSVVFNLEKEPFDNVEVRWALTLAIDIARVSMASYRGAATISAIHIPPTGMHPEHYFDPLEDWLREFTLTIDGGPYRPYDPDVALRIAEMARESLGDMVPTDPAEIRKALGSGWWRYDPVAAAGLLLQNGFTRNAQGQWFLPNGQRFRIALLAEGDTRPIMTRGAGMIVENWRDFGIDATLDVRDNPTRARLMPLGEFDIDYSWVIETWGGHPDLFFFLESWHSDFYRPTGEMAVARNRMRWLHPELDRIIEDIQRTDFDDPIGVELGREFVKLAVQEMPVIPIMSYNVFAVMDETYWEGFPTSDNPYANPVSNWANSRYMFPMLTPVQ